MWAQAAEALAEARLSRGDVEGSQRLWSELFELGKEMGAGAVHARAMAGQGLIAMLKGQIDTGRDDLENAVFRMRDQNPTKMLPISILRLAELAHAEGRLEAARELALDADAVARELPHLPVCVAALGLAARCLRDIGVPHEARLIAQDALTLFRNIGGSEAVSDWSSMLPAAGVLVPASGLGQKCLDASQSIVHERWSARGIDDPSGGVLAVKVGWWWSEIQRWLWLWRVRCSIERV